MGPCACFLCCGLYCVCGGLPSVEQLVGKVSELRVVETLGSTVRLGWTGVAGATQYRILIINPEGTARPTNQVGPSEKARVR